MNRELVRLLAFLQESSIIDRYLTYLKSGASDSDKLHLAMYLRFVESDWTPAQRLDLLAFYEDANKHKRAKAKEKELIRQARKFDRSQKSE